MADKKRKHAVKLQSTMTLGPHTSEFQIEKRRAAIKAALHSAVAGLAASTSSLAEQAIFQTAGQDGGTPPWGEVIIGPIWEQADPPGNVIRQEAELFWE